MDQPNPVSNHENPAMSPSFFVVKRMSCAVNAGSFHSLKPPPSLRAGPSPGTCHERVPWMALPFTLSQSPISISIFSFGAFADPRA